MSENKVKLIDKLFRIRNELKQYLEKEGIVLESFILREIGYCLRYGAKIKMICKIAFKQANCCASFT